MDDIGGPEVAQAEQDLGQLQVLADYITSDETTVASLGHMSPDNNDAQNYADNCKS